MTNLNEYDFNKLIKASLHDLKEIKIIKSVSVYKHDSRRYIAILEDHYSNFIEVLIGLKSSERVHDKIELAQKIESSAYIVLMNEPDNVLKLTTSDYASFSEMRKILGISMTIKERKELIIINEILFKKGLRI